MSPRVIDIVNFLIRRYIHENRVMVDDRSVIEILSTRGYSLPEIGEAFEFIFSGPEIISCDLMSQPLLEHNPFAQPVRVLSPLERLKFDLRAQGLIHMLSISNLLPEPDIERVISQAMALEQTEVGSQDLLPLIRETVKDQAKLALLTGYMEEVAASGNMSDIYH